MKGAGGVGEVVEMESSSRNVSELSKIPRRLSTTGRFSASHRPKNRGDFFKSGFNGKSRRFGNVAAEIGACNCTIPWVIVNHKMMTWYDNIAYYFLYSIYTVQYTVLCNSQIMYCSDMVYYSTVLYWNIILFN